MERRVKSILTEYTGLSAFSAKPKECEHHLVFGSGLRELSDQDGLILPLTNAEHNTGAIPERIHENIAAEKLSKMLGQVAWEEYYIARIRAMQCVGDLTQNQLDGYTRAIMREARDAFRKRYGISYL